MMHLKFQLITNTNVSELKTDDFAGIRSKRKEQLPTQVSTHA